MEEKSQEKRGPRCGPLGMYWELLVGVHPVLDLGLGQTLDVLTGMAGCLTTAEVQEVQSAGSLVQGLLVASRIAEVAVGALLDQGSGLGVVLLLSDDLLHRTNLLYSEITGSIIHDFHQNARKIFRKFKNSGMEPNENWNKLENFGL